MTGPINGRSFPLSAGLTAWLSPCQCPSRNTQVLPSFLPPPSCMISFLHLLDWAVAPHVRRERKHQATISPLLDPFFPSLLFPRSASVPSLCSPPGYFHFLRPPLQYPVSHRSTTNISPPSNHPPSPTHPRPISPCIASTSIPSPPRLLTSHLLSAAQKTPPHPLRKDGTRLRFLHSVSGEVGC